MTMMFSATVEDFDLAGLFNTLAKNDLNRAIDSARNLSAESTRSAATIAIARSVLIKKA
jgi:hypothetical protein